MTTKEKLKYLKKITEKHFEIEIRKGIRKNPYPDARKIYSNLAVKLFNPELSLDYIGSLINVDHSMILYYSNKCNDHMIEANFKRAYDCIKDSYFSDMGINNKSEEIFINPSNINKRTINSAVLGLHTI